MACFRMQPFYALPRHRAINFFLMAYHDGWLSYEQSLGVQLIEEITGAPFEENAILNVSNAASVAPIAGMPPSSSNDTAPGGPSDGSGGQGGSGAGGAGGEGEATATIAKAIMESSMYTESSDEGKCIISE